MAKQQEGERARHVTPEGIIARYFMDSEPAAVRTMLNTIKGIISSRPECREKPEKKTRVASVGDKVHTEDGRAGVVAPHAGESTRKD